jgi:hypothetical protein
LFARGRARIAGGGLISARPSARPARALGILVGLVLAGLGPTVALARPIPGPGGGDAPPPNAPPPRPSPSLCLDVGLLVQDNQTVPMVMPAPGQGQVVDATATITNKCGVTFGFLSPVGPPVGTPTWEVTVSPTCPPNPATQGRGVNAGFFDRSGNLPPLLPGRSTTVDSRRSPPASSTIWRRAPRSSPIRRHRRG